MVWLQGFRATAGAFGLLSLTRALDITFNGKPDSDVTYAAYYGVAALLFLIAIGLTAVIAKRHALAPGVVPEGEMVQTEPEREIVNVAPAYLVDFFKEHTDIQANRLLEPYIGKWMRVSGPLGNVMSSSGVRVQVTFQHKPLFERESEGMADWLTIYMYFPEATKDRLALLPRGTPITVLGRIRDAGAASIELEDCELEDGPSVPS
jgi:hypothetical protein